MTTEQIQNKADQLAKMHKIAIQIRKLLDEATEELDELEDVEDTILALVTE